MDLRAARNDGGNHRSANTAANVAHEIYQAGYAAALLLRHAHVRTQVDRHEEKGHAEYLYDAQHTGRPEAQADLELKAGVVHSQGDGEPAEGDQVASLDFGREYANDRHHEEQ